MVFCVLAILSFALQNLCCKEYGRHFPATLYSQAVMIAASTAVTAVVMAICGGAQALTPKGYIIALAFGLWFVITLGTMTLAMNYGHMGITLLIQNASLVVPALWGILFWGEKLTVWKGIGTVCVLILLVLSVGGNDDGANEEARKHWNKKLWIIFTALAFIGDSVLGILQGMMSRECGEVNAQTFTFWTSVFSVAIALLLMLGCVLAHKNERMLLSGKISSIFAGLCAAIGVGTAGGNCFSIKALEPGGLPSVVMFPLRQGGLVLVMWALGIIVYKEKVTKRGLLMLAVGLLGIILLNF